MKGRFLLGTSAHKGLQFSAAICMAYKLGHYAGRRYLTFFLPLHVLSGPFDLTLLYTDIESRYHHYDMSGDYQSVFFKVNPYTGTIRCVTKKSDFDTYLEACKTLLEKVPEPKTYNDTAWAISKRRTRELTDSRIREAIDGLRSGTGDWTFDVVAGYIRRFGTMNASLNVSYPQLEFTLSRGGSDIVVKAWNEWGPDGVLILSYCLKTARTIYGGKGKAVTRGKKQIQWMNETSEGGSLLESDWV